jgi:S1-C subfamily serine protease/Ca2+-binding EF-hand superfamily protein
VTLDMTKPMGFKLKADPATGKGVAVKALVPGGQAEAAGVFVPGTIITHFNGIDVTDFEDLKKVITLVTPGAPLILTIQGDAPAPSASPAAEAETESANAIESAMQFMNSQKEDESAMKITLDLSKPMGVKLMHNPATKMGVAVKAVVGGGQAEDTGAFQIGTIITHLNGTDVQEFTDLRQVAQLVKSGESLELTLAPLAALATEYTAIDEDEGNQTAPIAPNQSGLLAEVGESAYDTQAIAAAAAAAAVAVVAAAPPPMVPESTYDVAEPQADDAASKLALGNKIILDMSKPMGVKLMPNPKTPGKGIAVKGISEGGQAEATGGFKVGTVITHFNGVDVREITDLRDVMGLVTKGAPLELTVEDDTEKKKGVATPEEDLPLSSGQPVDTEGMELLDTNSDGIITAGELGAAGFGVADTNAMLGIPAGDEGQQVDTKGMTAPLSQTSGSPLPARTFLGVELRDTNGDGIITAGELGAEGFGVADTNAMLGIPAGDDDGTPPTNTASNDNVIYSDVTTTSSKASEASSDTSNNVVYASIEIASDISRTAAAEKTKDADDAAPKKKLTKKESKKESKAAKAKAKAKTKAADPTGKKGEANAQKKAGMKSGKKEAKAGGEPLDMSGGLNVFEFDLAKAPLGMKLMPNPLTKKGVAVKSVVAGGQAQTVADIQGGEVITHINDTDVRNFNDLKLVASLIAPGSVITIRLEESNRIDEVKSPFDSRPNEQGKAIKFDLGKGALGMKLMKNPNTKMGVAVRSVTEGGQAQTVGNVAAGDIIISVDGVNVESFNEVSQVTSLITPGEVVEIIFKDEEPTVVEKLSPGGTTSIGRKTIWNQPTTIDTIDPVLIPFHNTNSIRIVRGEGVPLGVKFSKNRDTGKGISIKSVDPEGIAADSGLQAGMIVTHLNRTDVTEITKMEQVAKLLKGATVVEMTTEIPMIDSDDENTEFAGFKDMLESGNLPHGHHKHLGPQKYDSTADLVSKLPANVNEQFEGFGPQTMLPPTADDVADEDHNFSVAAMMPKHISIITLDVSSGRPIGINLFRPPSHHHGAFVESLAPGGLASESGKIKAGMFITHINGKDVESVTDLRLFGPLLRANKKTVELVLYLPKGDLKKAVRQNSIHLPKKSDSAQKAKHILQKKWGNALRRGIPHAVICVGKCFLDEPIEVEVTDTAKDLQSFVQRFQVEATSVSRPQLTTVERSNEVVATRRVQLNWVQDRENGRNGFLLFVHIEDLDPDVRRVHSTQVGTECRFTAIDVKQQTTKWNEAETQLVDLAEEEWSFEEAAPAPAPEEAPVVPPSVAAAVEAEEELAGFGGDANVDDYIEHTVVFDLSDGKTLGMKLAPGLDGVGVAVKSVVEGGQAAVHGNVEALFIVSAINGVDVTKFVSLIEVGALVNKGETNSFTFRHTEAAADIAQEKLATSDEPPSEIAAEEEQKVPDDRLVIIIDKQNLDDSIGFKLTKDMETGKGVSVKSIDPAGPAAQTELKAGMVITHINMRDVTQVTKMAQLGRLLKQSVVVTLWVKELHADHDEMAHAARGGLKEVDDSKHHMQQMQRKLEEMFRKADNGEFGNDAPDHKLDFHELKYRLNFNELEHMLKANNSLQFFDSNHDSHLDVDELLSAMGKTKDDAVEVEEFVDIVMAAFRHQLDAFDQRKIRAHKQSITLTPGGWNQDETTFRKMELTPAQSEVDVVLENGQKQVVKFLEEDGELQAAKQSYAEAKATAKRAQDLLETLALQMQQATDKAEKAAIAETLRTKGVELLTALTGEEDAHDHYTAVNKESTEYAEAAAAELHVLEATAANISKKVTGLVASIAQTTQALGGCTDTDKAAELTGLITSVGAELTATLEEEQASKSAIEDVRAGRDSPRRIQNNAMQNQIDEYKHKTIVNAEAGKSNTNAMEQQMADMKKELEVMKEAAAQGSESAKALQATAAELAQVKEKQAANYNGLAESTREAALEQARSEILATQAEQQLFAQTTDAAKFEETIAAMAAELAEAKETALALNVAHGDSEATGAMVAAKEENQAAQEALSVASSAAEAATSAAAATDAAAGKKMRSAVSKSRWQAASSSSAADIAEAKAKRLSAELSKSADDVEAAEIQRKLRLERAKERRNRELARQAQINKEKALNNEAVFDDDHTFVLSKSLRQWTGTVESDNRGAEA